MNSTRIVVTGIGGLCAIGNSAPEIWDSMKSGRCGLGPLSIDRRDLRINYGGEIAAVDISSIPNRRRLAMARFSTLAVLAAGEALVQSGLDLSSENPTRIGSTIGVGVYGGDAVDENYISIFLDGKTRANPFTVPKAMPSAPAGQVSMEYGFQGPCFGVTSACSSSNHAISCAIDQMILGKADVMVAGGTDTPITYGVLKAWEALRVLARNSCRPFSADRDGLVLADGAGAVVLETFEHAAARGADILAEIAGYGLSADAGDIVAPTLEGPTNAMSACLKNGGISPTEVDYINAHGTATKANDRTETQAIRATFGADADRIAISSTKSMHGHCLGASGAIEVIACVNAIREGVVPPTVGYTTPDPECDLDVTPNQARERSVGIALSNAFAFGGLNAVVGFKRI